MALMKCRLLRVVQGHRSERIASKTRRLYCHTPPITNMLRKRDLTWIKPLIVGVEINDDGVFLMWPNWPIRSASGKLAKNRRWKSPTGKVQPTAPTPSDARRPARAGVKRSYFEKEKATSSHGEWLAWEEPRAVGDLVHVEKFFCAETWEVSSMLGLMCR